MKYCFTTLAVGESYFENSLKNYTEYSERCSADFNITTDTNHSDTPRVSINVLKLDKYHDNGNGFTFFLNLKVLALKHCLDRGYDYIVYNDGDWRMTPGFKEEGILKLFNYMDIHNVDMLFERPAKVGSHKQDLRNCFFERKLKDYHVFDHTKWDEAHVVNEQFLVFKNNWKFRLFIHEWEKFLWYSIHNDIRNYPDGFEIGVSALLSDMKYEYDAYRHHLPQMFEFYSKDGKLHTRF